MMDGGDFVKDIISDLPDSLLTHILSFLPTEEAVCTCILSKRWINVWISLPILVFDDHKCREDNLTKEEFQKREDKFIRFLCGVISNREINLTLDTFKVTWRGNVSDTPLHIFGCLYCAVECRPRILSIHIKTCKFFYLPDSIFTSTSVEEMSLWLHIYRREVQFIKLESFNLPFLKKLELGYLNLNDDIMRMLISGCPILEELILIDCALEGNIISSNVLKKLVLKHCFHYAPMEISCPAVVVSLSIESVNTEGIALKNMLSLIMAEIYCQAVFLFDTLHYDMRLLGGLSNVTSLKLYTRSPDVMGLMRVDIPNCPILKNLKCLDLGVININDDWNLVTCLLQHSSNLKDLTLHFYRPSEEIVKEEFRGDISFQHEYLKAVKISCPGKTVKLVVELVRTLGAHIETTSKIIIL